MPTRTQATNPATISEATKRTLGSFFRDIDKIERGERIGSKQQQTSGQEESVHVQNASGTINLGLCGNSAETYTLCE